MPPTRPIPRWRHIIGTILPRGCAGCGKPDETLCETCTQALHTPVAYPLPNTLTGHGIACGTYEGPVRHAILSWKDHNDTEIDTPLGDALTDLFDTTATHTTALLDTHPNGLGIVPAPSTPHSTRRRGRRQLDPLAQTLATHCRTHGYPHTTVLPLLRTDNARGKSVQTTGARDRMRRINGHVTIDKHIHAATPPMPLILLDDIVTTGATMGACAHTLTEAGYDVLTALALAYTPPKDDARHEDGGRGKS